MASKTAARLMPALALAALVLTASASTQAQGGPQLHALLLNGGGSPQVNFLSHHHHLEDMMSVLIERGVPKDRITVFSSDGEDEAPDLMTAGGKSHKNRWLLGATDLDKHLKTSRKIENTVWKGVKLHPARYDELRGWFKAQTRALKSGDTLMVFVTDHGRQGKHDADNGDIVLWDEDMSVIEFRALLGHLKPGVRVVSVMSQCFSGTFGASIYPLGGELPDGNACGFYATRNDRFAYGCYPEGRGRDQIGHAFQFIDAMRDHDSLDDAHAQVSLLDDSPDVPLRSSDIFLARRLEAEASARELDLDTMTDELLGAAFKDPKKHAAALDLIDRIASTYDLTSHRALQTLSRDTELSDHMIKSADKASDAWDQSYDALRRANLSRFRADGKYGPRWGARIKPAALQDLKDAQKDDLLKDLLPDLTDFTKASGDTFETLRDMRSKRHKAGQVKYRMEIRHAMFLRMRHTLMRVAGETLLAMPSASMTDARRRDARDALDRLALCESTAPGSAQGKGKPRRPEALASLAVDAHLLNENTPSRLGIGYEPVSAQLRARHKLAEGAVKVNRVLKGSAAARAGIKLDDIVTGHKGGAFVYKDHIRHWIMTAPHTRDVTLAILRGAEAIDMRVRLLPIEIHMPKVPVDLKVGVASPAYTLPKGVKAPRGEATLLFFWSSWSRDSQKALGEVMAWSEASGTRVIAISDDQPDQLDAFKTAWRGAMPTDMVADPARETFQSFRVHTAPTMVLIDAKGVVRFVKAGHKAGEAIKIPRA